MSTALEDRWADMAEEAYEDDTREEVEAMSLATYEGHQAAVAELRKHAEALGLNLSAWFEPQEIPTVGTGDDGTITCPHCGRAQEDIEVACNDGLAYLASFDDGVWTAYPDYSTDNELEPLGCYCLDCNGWFDPERVVLR